jgi:hypothetical protein
MTIDLFEDLQLVRGAEAPTFRLFHDLRIGHFASKITHSVGDPRGRSVHLCLLHHDSMLPRPDSFIFSLGVSHVTLARGGVAGLCTSPHAPRILVQTGA